MDSIEGRASWVVAGGALAVLSVAWGAPLLSAVAMKPIATALGSARSVPALAGSAAYLGSALGGLAMGPLAERVGVRRIAAFGLASVAAGLAVSAQGSEAALLLSHFVLIGLLGLGCLFAPLLTLVTRWFDRRRGTAVALVSSGQYLAGVAWPNAMEWCVDRFGWQTAMLAYAAVVAVTLPLCLLLRRPPARSAAARAADPAGGRVLGLSPNMATAALAAAVFLCCVAMAMPPAHLVALCSDAGLPPARGATMLAVMLGLAFASRQLWGWMADRLGGLPTVLACSTVQAAAIAGFLLTQSEAGLFAAASVFGLGFSGIVPGYVVAVRDLFPEREAPFRVPVVLLAGQSSMAVGGWLAGAIYDAAGAYGPAFAAGLAFNLVNLALLGWLLGRGPWGRPSALPGGVPAR